MPPRAKRVSFQDNTQFSFLKPTREESSNVEISELFPNMGTPRSILRHAGSRQSLSPRSDSSKISKEKRKVKTRPKPDEVKPEEVEPKKRRQPVLLGKEPTESLAHALLRAMTHKEPNFQSKTTKVLLPKLNFVSTGESKRDDDRSSMKSQMSNSSRGRLPAMQPRNCSSRVSTDERPVLPEIVATPRETQMEGFDKVCGQCQRLSMNQISQKPASGFCSYCDEYLCAKCVMNHRRKLTKLHPVLVFCCETCKEMNILIRRGSGYCIQCRHFYCCVCLVGHCSRTDHDMLEGRDLIDIIDSMTGR